MMSVLGLVIVGLLSLQSESSILSSQQSGVKVPTSSGVLHGKTSVTLNKPLRLFLGVPYALPPVGNLRFRPPVELKTEGAVIDASRFAPSCSQPPHLSSVISPLLKPNQAEIAEDCLYLNIYVPGQEQSVTPLPVMVWLPGEGFDYADPQQFDGSYLAVEGDVIVVTVNYRLSVFGFLSALSKDAPGNVGLLDQRMALQWVKENIGGFGGNPDDVTLFGRFTGSMSAAIHAFSPLSKKEQLFQKVILQSGVPTADWVFDRNPLNATLSLAESVNCLADKTSDLLECLRSKSAESLLDAALHLPTRFRPIFDFHLIYETTLKAAAKSDYQSVDVMLGMTKDEGSLCTIALKAMESPLYPKLVDNTLSADEFLELVKMNLFDFKKREDELITKLTTFKYKSSKKSFRDQFVQFCGDLFLKSNILKLAEELADKEQNTYVYEFNHRPSFSIHPDFISAAHGDDVLFTLGLPFMINDLPADEARLTRRMVEAVTNFARSGNPNPIDSQKVWSQYTSDDRQIMHFDTTTDSSEKELENESDIVVFWQEIIPSIQERDCPFPPMVSSLVGSPRQDQHQQGTFVTLPVLMAGFGVAAFAAIIIVVSVALVIRATRKAAFRRLS